MAQADPSRGSRRRLEGGSAILEAFGSGEAIACLLVPEAGLTALAERAVACAREADVPISFESEREMRRMSCGPSACDAIAVLGGGPDRGLDGLMKSSGLVLMLVGLRYPGNVGFILRSAEVAGAAGVVLSNDWKSGELEEARRVSIRADRFLPVLEASADEAVSAARAAGRQIVALETSGERAPWAVDLSRPSVVVLGSETDGVPEDVLREVDVLVRIPTRGVIPSYNVQAAAGMMLGEWLRQNAAGPAPDSP